MARIKGNLIYSQCNGHKPWHICVGKLCPGGPELHFHGMNYAWKRSIIYRFYEQGAQKRFVFNNNGMAGCDLHGLYRVSKDPDPIQMILTHL